MNELGCVRTVLKREQIWIPVGSSPAGALKLVAVRHQKMLYLVAAGLGLVLPSKGLHSTITPRAAMVTMQQSQQNFDNDMSGWKPPSGGSSGHALGADASAFTSTDTPDFLPDEGSELDRMAKGVSFQDGMSGSQVDPNRKKSTGPELAGALDSDPDIYVPEAEEMDATKAGIEFVLPKSGMTDLDFDMFCDSTGAAKDMTIDVRPVAMTFEEFYCGFTADSHPAFSVSPTSGKMERRNGPPTTVTVTVNPQGASGELVGHLCFILPEEKMFSTYYKITCQSR